MPWFGERLREIRTRKNLTLDEAARKAGYTDGATISKYEGFKWPPERHVVNRLARAWGFTLRELGAIDLPEPDDVGRISRPPGRPKKARAAPDRSSGTAPRAGRHKARYVG